MNNPSLGSLYLNKAIEVSSKIEAQSKSYLPEMVGAYESLFELLIAFCERIQGARSSITNSQLEADIQRPIAIFYKELPLMHRALFSGHYASMAAIQKQQIDALAISIGRPKGKIKDGMSPRIQNILGRDMQKVRGKLEGVAHLTGKGTTEILALDEGSESYSWLPHFDGEIFRSLIEVQIYILLKYIWHLDNVWRESYSLSLSEGEKLKFFQVAEYLSSNGKQFGKK